MQIGVLYTGIIVNASLTLLLSILTVKELLAISKTRESWRTRRHVAVLGGLLSTALVNASILLLYIQVGQLQYSIGQPETFWPILILLGYHVTLLSMSCIIWRETYASHRYGLVVIVLQAILSVYCICFANDFEVLWEGGPVLLLYTSAADPITILMGLVIGGAILYHSYVRRVMAISAGQVDDMGSKAYLMVALAFFAQFLVPRAVAGSILDPFSVKLVGMTVVVLFAYSLHRYSSSIDMESQFQVEVEGESVTAPSLGPSTGLLVAAITLVTTFALASRFQPLITADWKEYLQSQSILVGVWNGSNVYISTFAVVIPLVVWLSLMALLTVLKRKECVQLTRISVPWLILTGALGSLILVASSFSYALDGMITEELVYRSVAPFLVAPILSHLCIKWYASRKTQTTEKAEIANTNSLTRASWLYGTVLISALIADLIAAFPPLHPFYNNIFIGAGGFFDGLFWAPILAVVVYEVFHSSKTLL